MAKAKKKPKTGKVGSRKPNPNDLSFNFGANATRGKGKGSRGGKPKGGGSV